MEGGETAVGRGRKWPPEPKDALGKLMHQALVFLPMEARGANRFTTNVQCKFCGMRFTYNSSRLPRHFAGSIGTQFKSGDIKDCKDASVEFRKAVHDALIRKDRKNQKRSVENRTMDRDSVENMGILSPGQRTSSGSNLGSIPPRLSRGTSSGNVGEVFRPTTDEKLDNPQVGLPRLSQTTVRELFDEQGREKADVAWAMVACLNGWSFRSLTHPKLQEAVNLSRTVPGYKLPSNYKLRGPLLEKVYNEVREGTEEYMFGGAARRRFTISCDGWTTVQGRPLMNILLSNNNGEMFTRAIDGSGLYKQASWIAEHVIEEIERVGSTHVFHFVCDNAATNIAAGKLVVEKFPHIVWGGCVAHGLDLVCHDMGKMEWIGSLFDKCRQVVKFIKNHHMTNAVFMDKFSNGLQLLKPAETRFATNYIMLDRAFELRFQIRSMIVSQDWKEFTDRLPTVSRDVVRQVENTVLDDDYWNQVEDVREIMECIFVLLRQVDMNKNFMGVVYWESWETYEKLQKFWREGRKRSDALSEERCAEIARCFKSRWLLWSNILQTTAMCLNPYFIFHQDFMESYERAEVKDQFRRYCKIYGRHMKKLEEDDLDNYVHQCSLELMTISMRNGHFGEKLCNRFAIQCKKDPERW